MWKRRFVSWVLMMVMMLTITPLVAAQSPLPPEELTLSDPVIVETSRLEWVETAGGQRQLVPAFTMEQRQESHLSSQNSPNSNVAHPSGWTMTMWRALQWSPSFWGGYSVNAGASTSTSVTANTLYVWVDHQYRSPGGTWRGVASNYANVGGVTTTGERWTMSTTIAAGLEHTVRADHQAFVGNTSLIYNNQWGPQRIIP